MKHRSDPRVLGRRTLQHDHRCLAALLRPGMKVLDVGCGTGSITAGIAQAVGESGLAVGIDRDETLLEIARTQHGAIPQLRFESGDATDLPYRAGFDVVTAARVLQWIPQPGRVVEQMRRAARGGGTVVVLDYNHAASSWEPEPPREFRLFYDSFLAWRRANGWDNLLGDRLPGPFRDAGLLDIRYENQDEITRRGEPGFEERVRLWADVIESMGSHLAGEGLCTELQLLEARQAYESFLRDGLVRQILSLRAALGGVP